MAEQTATRTAHTPGPWLAEYNERDGGFTILLGEEAIGQRGSWASETRVDYMDGLWDRWNDGPLTGEDLALFERAQANARLIAAAPDLLAALTDLVERFTPEYMTDIAAINSAKAAIAKAMGASS